MFWPALAILIILGFARSALFGPPGLIEILIWLAVDAAVTWLTRERKMRKRK